MTLSEKKIVDMLKNAIVTGCKRDELENIVQLIQSGEHMRPSKRRGTRRTVKMTAGPEQLLVTSHLLALSSISGDEETPPPAPVRDAPVLRVL